MDFTAGRLSPEACVAHDALNERIARDTFKNKILGFVRDGLFNGDLTLKDFNHWVALITEEEGPKRKRVTEDVKKKKIVEESTKV